MFIKKEKKNYKIELSQRFKTSFLEFLRLNCIINCVKENTTKTYHFNTEDFSRRWSNQIKRITIFLILHNIYFLKKTVADHNPNQFFPAIIFFSIVCILFIIIGLLMSAGCVYWFFY